MQESSGRKTALITGATSGIGKACAEILAENGYHLILTGRRSERLEATRRVLEVNFAVEIKTLCFDVREREETASQLNSLAEKWRKIDVLVNNAGLASGLSDIQNGDFEDWDKMLDTNIKGILNISKVIIPWMIEAKGGHIINIGSIAGKEVYPKGNVYNASKFAVTALTKAMRMDLLPHRIKVSLVAPGHVETEFAEVRFHGDKEKAKSVYQGFTPLAARDVAEVVWFMASRPPHVNIDDVLILPTDQASATLINREG